MRATPADNLLDEELVRRFEACDLPLEWWSHRSHLRVAYTLLCGHDLDVATERMSAGIKRFNAARDVPDGLDRGYHETFTQAWLRILHLLIQSHGPEENSTAFLDRHPYLETKLLLRLFYTRDQIITEKAKRSFVEPNVARL